MGMARNPDMVVAEFEEIVAPAAIPGRAATDWGAIIGGAVGAIGVTIILFTAGSGFGISTLEPWSFTNRAPETFVIGAGIWLIVMQWLSAAFGGYFAGRLRSRWIGVRTDEVLFRDTAHGFLAWAVATVAIAALFTLGAAMAGTAVVTADTPAEAAAAVTEQARDVAATFSIFTAISLLVGAFIGAAAGGLGGYHRDA
jgi:hypothetical protein